VKLLVKRGLLQIAAEHYGNVLNDPEYEASELGVENGSVDDVPGSTYCGWNKLRLHTTDEPFVGNTVLEKLDSIYEVVGLYIDADLIATFKKGKKFMLQT
jgi:hypothetical protein